jgi:chromosomal replication initiator protein
VRPRIARFWISRDPIRLTVTTNAAPASLLLSSERARDLWSRVLTRLRGTSKEYEFSWIARLRCDGSTPDGELALAVPNPFYRDFIRDHYLADVEAALLAESGQSIPVVFAIDESIGLRGVELSPPPATRPTRGRVDDRFRFDNFVVATSNQLAWAGAKAMSDNPGVAFNPLFIYGGTGLGKTHLLNAVGNALLARKPQANVFYLSSEEFTNEFIGSLSHHRMPEFRRRYREECDVLLIDDIQSLAGKEQTQEEFFHTFNTLTAARKPVALTSDVPPAEIEGLENRLKSRFQAGLITDVQEPDFETRVAILVKKAEELSAPLPGAVAQFIARHIQGNIRALEGALTRLWAIHSLTGQAVTEQLAAHVLKDILPQSRTIDIEEVQKECARYYRISLDDLRSERRHKQLAHARQVAMYLARELTGASFPEIGKRFNRDHSTVISGCRKIEAAYQAAEPVLRKEIDELTRRIAS